MTTTNKHEIAFIDQGVDDLDVLTKGIRPDVELFLLINNEPALRQMARAVEGRKGLEAVHIIAHGQPGEIAFSAGLLSLETIDQDRDDLAVLGSVIGEGGELRLWSCAVAQGEHGAAFVHAITNATGAKVAASVRRVGAAARGGSWELSSIEKPTLAPPPITAAGQRAYAGVLDTNNTTISGNNSTNTLSVTGSNDKISDGNGTNSVTVTGNNNTVSDGNGTNTVAVTGNNNTVSDGNGTNTITVSGNNNTISDGNGSNTIIASGSNATISDGNGGNLIYAKDTSGTNSISDGNGSNIIVGGSGTDTISAGNGSNIIYGGAGNDTIKVGNGSDVIMAGAGTDTVTAGNGNDLFIYAISDHYTVVGSQLQSIANDVDTYVAGGGTDTIRIVVTADEYSLMNTQLTGYANWLATHKGSSATYSLNFGTGGGLSLNGFEALQVQIVNPGTINLAAGANSSTGSLNSLNLFSNTVGTSSTNFTDTFKIVGVAAGNAGASATTLDPSLAVAKYLDGTATLPTSYTVHGADGTLTVNADGTYSYTVTSHVSLSDTFTLTTLDQNGFVTSTTLTFGVPNLAAPIVTLTHDTAGAGTGGTASDHLTKDGSLTVSGAVGTTITYAVDGGAFSASYNPAALADGSHTVDVKLTDQAGNTADTSINFTLDTTTAAPTVVLTNDTARAGTSGTSSDHLTKDASLSVSGTEAGAAITYAVDGGAFTASYDPTSLADGGHTVDVKSTDQAGNTADTSISFTLDTTTAAPTVVLTNDTAGAGTSGTASDHLTKDGSLTVSGTEAGAAVSYSVDGAAFTSSYDPTSLADGSHTVDVKS
ncbi:DUF4347 domain-containing protein, partial [Bradyrhizobium sp. Ec3.3]|uniref:DUF4347 domain-containing protein n=1 Tax=Bradyrhizobium sp. Ec3.3 TaxID=189753 RepID=UPI0012EC5B20